MQLKDLTSLCLNEVLLKKNKLGYSPLKTMTILTIDSMVYGIDSMA